MCIGGGSNFTQGEGTSSLQLSDSVCDASNILFPAYLLGAPSSGVRLNNDWLLEDLQEQNKTCQQHLDLVYKPYCTMEDTPYDEQTTANIRKIAVENLDACRDYFGRLNEHYERMDWCTKEMNRLGCIVPAQPGCMTKVVMMVLLMISVVTLSFVPLVAVFGLLIVYLIGKATGYGKKDYTLEMISSLREERTAINQHIYNHYMGWPECPIPYECTNPQNIDVLRELLVTRKTYTIEGAVRVWRQSRMLGLKCR